MTEARVGAICFVVAGCVLFALAVTLHGVLSTILAAVAGLLIGAGLFAVDVGEAE